MLKPGQLFNYKGKRYNVSKKVFTGAKDTCDECERFYNHTTELMPCIENVNFPCTRYCGMTSFPKLIKMCKK